MAGLFSLETIKIGEIEVIATNMSTVETSDGWSILYIFYMIYLVWRMIIKGWEF